MEVGHSRYPAEVERDRRVIASLYLRGVPQHEIAEKLGISAPTVRNDLKVIEEQWVIASTTELGLAKARELAKVDNLEFEYWAAWDNSKKDAEIETDEESEAKGRKKTFQRRGQSGNHEFLKGVGWCIDKRCQILGLNAPERNINFNLDLLPVELLERIVAGESAITVFAEFAKRQDAKVELPVDVYDASPVDMTLHFNFSSSMVGSSLLKADLWKAKEPIRILKFVSLEEADAQA